ncbi:MAG: hypothetical protein LBV27_03640, partial [Oscillospiraceae bacterium]|nr:hypothetical protein [Oscillospiraceae bacterium]
PGGSGRWPLPASFGSFVTRQRNCPSRHERQALLHSNALLKDNGIIEDSPLLSEYSGLLPNLLLTKAH